MTALKKHLSLEKGAGDTILKERTRSLCSVCLDEVEARVVKRAGRILMLKRCPRHGPTEVPLEEDQALYQTLYNPARADHAAAFHSLALTVTDGCDLDCGVCYMPRSGRADVPLATLKGWIDDFPGRMIWLTGGEPTTRQDLPRIIGHVLARGKIPVLITNGLRLADRAYAARLRQAGLCWVHFSFNGFDDDVYRRINGSPLLAPKLRALGNLRALGFHTVLSMLFVRGVSEEQVEPVVRYCLRHGDAVRQLRIRPERRIHKGGRGGQVFLSELLRRVASALGETPENLVRHGTPRGAGGGFAYVAGSMPCHLDIDLGRYLQRTMARHGRGPRAGLARARWWRRRIGLKDAARRGVLRVGGGLTEDLVIRLRAWPDRDSIDLEEMKRCVSGYMPRHGGAPLPFCQSLILNDEKRIL